MPRPILFLLLTPLLLATTAATSHGGRGAIPETRTPVFSYGRFGGFNRVGAYSVTLYGDGTVSLQGSPYLHLRHPHVVQPKSVIKKLLHLADQRDFFSLPASIGHPIPDVGVTRLTVTSGQRSHEVEMLGGADTPEEQQEQARFFSVYAAVASLTPLCFKPPGASKAGCWKS